ncbi:MAG: hypothetical protein V4485_06265 [Pseudomonadota bacterium]
MNWIISKNQDLLWFIGPSTLGLLMIATYYFLTGTLGLDPKPVNLVLILFWSTIDMSHYFASYTRTYFNKQYFKNHKILLMSGLGFFLCATFALFASYAFSYITLTEVKQVIVIISYISLCFAYYHLARQHWGFISLYRLKNNETDVVSRKVDALVLTSGILYPFVKFILFSSHSSIMSITYVSVDTWHFASNVFLISGAAISAYGYIFRNSISRVSCTVIRSVVFLCLAVFMGVYITTMVDKDILRNTILNLCFYLFIVSFCVFIYLSFKSKVHNYPKWMIMSVIIISNNIILSFPLSYGLLYGCIAIFHNLQYLKIVEHTNNKEIVGRSFIKKYYVLLVALWGILITSAIYITSKFSISEIYVLFLIVILYAIPWHHYFLDSFIWRHRHDANLRKVFN